MVDENYSTYSAYALLVANHIEPFFGEKEEFTEPDIQQFVLEPLRSGLSEKTVKDIVAAEPKTRESNRDIPLSGELLKIVRPLAKVVNPNFYVLSNAESPIEPRTYRSYYKRILKKLGIPDLKFHGLRHSFATRCIESKNSVKTVSVILGHSNITTTMNLYVHPDNKEKKRCIERMLKDIL